MPAPREPAKSGAGRLVSERGEDADDLVQLGLGKLACPRESFDRIILGHAAIGPDGGDHKAENLGHGFEYGWAIVAPFGGKPTNLIDESRINGH
jgi:hypothetical protein